MFAPGAVPKQNGPFTLDFYADHDNSRRLRPRPGERARAITRGASSLDRRLCSTRHGRVTSIAVRPQHVVRRPHRPGAAASRSATPATIRLANMGAFVGKRVEVRIADASSKRVVAFYRVPSLADAARRRSRFPG